MDRGVAEFVRSDGAEDNFAVESFHDELGTVAEGLGVGAHHFGQGGSGGGAVAVDAVLKVFLFFLEFLLSAHAAVQL